MKILYDYQAFTMQKYGGVSRGFCEIISRLPFEAQWEIAVKESENVYLKEYGIDRNIVPSKHPFSSFLKGFEFRGKKRLYDSLAFCRIFQSPERLGRELSIRLLQKGKYDIFHPTFFNPYFIPFIKNKPTVLIVHDLVYEVLDEKFHFRNRSQIEQRKILTPIISHFVCPSQNTAKDLMKFYNVPSCKISVIYWGGTNLCKRFSLKRVIKERYLLYIGGRGKYKNWNDTVIQLAPLLKSQDIRLVCTGCDFTRKERNLLRKLGVSDKVIHFFVSSDELSGLYNNAELFIYPSFYEGFGIPILEAFANECPTILSDCSCFPEIGGDAVAYFNPYKSDALLPVVYKVLNDVNYRNSLIARGCRRVKDFTWENTAKQYFNTYKSLI